MAKKPALNSLDRFRKQSPRLVLEEHGHCEVPAGCGGVVLRWTNPGAAVAVTVGFWAPVETPLAFDGKTLLGSAQDLAPGRHVLTLVLENVDLSMAFLTVHVGPWPRPVQSAEPSSPDGFPFASRPDGSWRHSLEKPPDDWQRPDFDDRPWPHLANATPPILGERDSGYWQLERCLREGAIPLGLECPVAARGTVWVRRLFTIPTPVLPLRS